jgi:hypothetical protein
MGCIKKASTPAFRKPPSSLPKKEKKNEKKKNEPFTQNMLLIRGLKSSNLETC